MTPETARALEPGTTPGPWEPHPDHPTILVNMAEKMAVTMTPGKTSDHTTEDAANRRLIAAAPDMRATIAAQTWEWGVEDAYGDTAWMVCDHYEGTQDSETEAREYLSTFGPDSIARLVRRLVGPVEVMEP